MTDVELNEAIQASALPVLRQLSREDLIEIRGALELLTAELKPYSRRDAFDNSFRNRWIRSSALWIACNHILEEIEQP